MISKFTASLKIASGPLLWLVLLRAGDVTWVINYRATHNPLLTTLAGIKLFVVIGAESGLYASLYRATHDQPVTVAGFTQGMQQYFAPFVWVTLVLGVVTMVAWAAAVGGWAIVSVTPFKEVLNDPRWTTRGFPLVGAIVEVCFLYAVPYIFLEGGWVAVPLGRAFRFLRTHLRASWPVAVVTVGSPLLGFWSYRLLTSLGAGGFPATLVKVSIGTLGDALAFIVAVLILQEYHQQTDDRRS